MFFFDGLQFIISKLTGNGMSYDRIDDVNVNHKLKTGAKSQWNLVLHFWPHRTGAIRSAGPILLLLALTLTPSLSSSSPDCSVKNSSPCDRTLRCPLQSVPRQWAHTRICRCSNLECFHFLQLMKVGPLFLHRRKVMEGTLHASQNHNNLMATLIILGTGSVSVLDTFIALAAGVITLAVHSREWLNKLEG